MKKSVAAFALACLMLVCSNSNAEGPPMFATAPGSGGVGDITGVTAGTGISGGGTSGTVTVTLDPTELDDITWGAAAGTSQTWTWDTGAGTDPTCVISDTGHAFGLSVSAGTAVNPDAADGATVGTADLEWSDLYLADGGVIYWQNDQSVSLTGSAGALTSNAELSVTKVNAAGGSANALTVSGTLGIMDGSDTWNGLNIAPTNADHTGSANEVNGIKIADITGDAQATEAAILVGTGWDRGIQVGWCWLNVTGAWVCNVGLDAQQNGDFNGETLYQFRMAEEMYELTGTGSQTVFSIAPEFDVSTRTGAATLTHLRVGDGAGGGYTGTPAAQALTLLGVSVTSTPPVLTSDDAYTAFLAAPTNSANHTGGALNMFYANPSAVDADTTTYLFRGAVNSVDAFTVNNTGDLMSRSQRISLTADAVLQVGMVAMVDAGTDERFDVNGAGGTLALGIVTDNGLGPTVQGTAYNLAIDGKAYFLPTEDVAITRGHVLYQDASVAGCVNDNAALQATGLNVGQALRSEAMYTICATGACVDEGTDTITLSSAPGWAVNDLVVYWNSGGSTLGGLVEGRTYYVKTIADAAVVLAETRGGAAINLTNDGTDATQYLIRLPLGVVRFN